MSNYHKASENDIEWEKRKEEQFQKNCQFMYNVQDRFKGKDIQDIKEEIKSSSLPGAVMMVNIEGDFNIGGVFRSGNCFNFYNLFYFGKKKRDKRAEVGIFNYSNIQYLDTFEKILELKKLYKFVALENNISRSPKNILQYKWEPNSLIIVGSESNGISKEVLDICDDFIEIPIMGTCRSFNAASAATIAMYDYVAKYNTL